MFAARRLPESSRRSKRSEDLRVTSPLDRTPEGCQIFVLAERERLAPFQGAEKEVD
jgi:hypothetical protein